MHFAPTLPSNFLSGLIELPQLMEVEDSYFTGCIL